MSEKKEKFSSTAKSLLVVIPFIMIEMFVSYHNNVPHFSIAVFTAQLISLLVCHQGQICFGQRKRLIAINTIFALYWLLWVILNHLLLSQDYHIDVMSLCGLAVAYCLNKHAKFDKISGNNLLKMAALLAVFGSFIAVLDVINQPIQMLVEFSPISQVLVGVILANLMLLLSRSRLQVFIKLLNNSMILLLVSNAVIFFIFIIALTLAQISYTTYITGYMIYLAIHLISMALLVIPFFKRKTLNYLSLFTLLLLISSLPIWLQISVN